MTPPLADLYLLRHGESTANAQGLFTGVLDPSLTPLGLKEARGAAALLVAAGGRPALAFHSALRRTTETVAEMLPLLGDPAPRVEADWRLDERNYGALTGQSKAAVAARYGVERFLAWRRSFALRPPALAEEQLEALRAAEPFRSLPPEALTPAESLEDVVARVVPFVAERLLPALVPGAPVLVVAHGNSLRALSMVLEGLSPEEVEHLAIPTGQPLRYRFDLRVGTPVLAARAYLDPDTALPAAELLGSQGGT